MWLGSRCVLKTGWAGFAAGQAVGSERSEGARWGCWRSWGAVSQDWDQPWLDWERGVDCGESEETPRRVACARLHHSCSLVQDQGFSARGKDGGGRCAMFLLDGIGLSTLVPDLGLSSSSYL